MKESELTKEMIKSSTVYEILLFYDIPVLYICEIANEKYIVMLCDDCEGSQTWLYASISQKVLQAVMNNKITLYSLFSNHKNVHKVLIDKNEKYLIKNLKGSMISDEFLPQKNVYLEYDQKIY